MKTLVLKKNPDAKIPEKAHDSDFAYDVYATSEQELAPGVWKYGLGIALQIETKPFKETMVIGYRLDSRSSVWKTGMILSNGPGTIDMDYTGEICAVFYQVIPEGTPWKDGDKTGVIERYHVGDKLGQIHLEISWNLEFEEVDSLEETERGEKGYGSSGK